MKFSLEELDNFTDERAASAQEARGDEPAAKKARGEEAAIPVRAAAGSPVLERRRKGSAEGAAAQASQQEAPPVTRKEAPTRAKSVATASGAKKGAPNEAGIPQGPKDGVPRPAPAPGKPPAVAAAAAASAVARAPAAASPARLQERDPCGAPLRIGANVSLIKDPALSERMMDASLPLCDITEGRGRTLEDAIQGTFAQLYTQGRELVLIRDYCRNLVRRDGERSSELASLKALAGRKEAEALEAGRRIKVFETEAAIAAKAKKVVEEELESKRARLKELRAESEAAKEKALAAEKKAAEVEEKAELLHKRAEASEEALLGSHRLAERLKARLAESSKKADAAEKAATEAAAKATAEAVAAFKESPEYMKDFREAATDSYLKGFAKCFDQLTGLLSKEQLESLQVPGRKKKQAATTPAAERQEAPPGSAAPQAVAGTPASEGKVPPPSEKVAPERGTGKEPAS